MVPLYFSLLFDIINAKISMMVNMKPLERVYHKASQLTVPLMVHFDLTYRCHQRCLHCYLPEAWRRGEQAKAELDTGQVKRILDQLAAAGTFLLTFSGGEIFLRPDLMELLHYARRRNFSITLLTTGTCGLDAEQCRALAELGLEAVHVSLYSMNPQVHDAITQISGSWVRLWQTLSYLRTAGIRVGFNCLVCNLNYRELATLKSYADREGCLIRFDNQLSLRWDGRPHPPELALSLENAAYLDKHWLVNESEEPLSVAPNHRGGCNAGIIACYIGASGEVWPCVDLPWNCGNLQDGGRFDHIWQQSAALVRVRSLKESQHRPSEKLCAPYQQQQMRLNRVFEQ